MTNLCSRAALAKASPDQGCQATASAAHARAAPASITAAMRSRPISGDYEPVRPADATARGPGHRLPASAESSPDLIVASSESSGDDAWYWAIASSRRPSLARTLPSAKWPTA